MAHENPHRLQPARAKQRDELISRDQKRDEVNASERALKAEPGQPEFGREMHSRTPPQLSATGVPFPRTVPACGAASKSSLTGAAWEQSPRRPGFGVLAGMNF